MNRVRGRAMLAVGLLVLGGCVDGDVPLALEGVEEVRLGAVTRFSVVPSASVVSSLEMVRFKVWQLGSEEVVLQDSARIDPTATEWAFELTLQVLEDEVLNLELDVELVGAGGAVEFAGQDTVEVRASYDASRVVEVELGRGPLANLSVTSLAMSLATYTALEIREGGSDELVVVTEGGGSDPVVYFETSDVGVVSVDAGGVIRAVSQGRAKVVAQAGRQADTLELVVEPVELAAPAELEEELGEQASYVAGELFVGTMSDPGAAQELAEAVETMMTEMLAGRGPEAVGWFEQALERWDAYGSGTELRVLDGPQLGVVLITLLHAADALGIAFDRIF